MRSRKETELRQENLKESGQKRYSRPLFPKLFYMVPNAKLHYITINSVEHSPPTHTHTHVLSAKKPLPNYLPLAKALQPHSTILGPRVDKNRGQSDAPRRGTFCCLSLKKRRRPTDVLKEQVW